MSTTDLESMKENIVGLPISYSWRGHGSAIFLEFGNLTKDPKRQHPKGEYSLMLDCGWRAEGAKSILCGSFSEKGAIDSQLEQLLGESVAGIEIYGNLPELVVFLSSGLRLASFTADEGQPEWTIFLPDSSWLCCVDGSVTRQQAEQNKQADA